MRMSSFSDRCSRSVLLVTPAASRASNGGALTRLSASMAGPSIHAIQPIGNPGVEAGEARPLGKKTGGQGGVGKIRKGGNSRPPGQFREPNGHEFERC